MGCKRPNTIEASEMPIGTNAVEVMTIPPNACEGQMTFLNRGNTNLMVSVASKACTAKNYYVYLVPGRAWSEEGVIPGKVTVLSDAAGGIFSGNASFVTST